MSSKSWKYTINSDAPPLTKIKKKNAALLQVAANLYKSSMRKTYAYCFLACAVCGPYAYYIWSHKKPKQVPVVEKMETSVEENKKEDVCLKMKIDLTKDYGFIDIEAEDFSFSKYCISNNPDVIFNDKLERFEIYNRGRILKTIRTLSAKNVEKDDNDDFLFDDAGYPISVPYTISRFFQELYHRSKDYFAYLVEEIFKRPQ